MNARPLLNHATALLIVSGIVGVDSAALAAPEQRSVAPATEWSAQTRERPRIRVTPDQPAAYDYPRPGPYAPPGPGYVRQCADWYAIEDRPSGTVITPQMRCRWVRR